MAHRSWLGREEAGKGGNGTGGEQPSLGCVGDGGGSTYHRTNLLNNRIAISANFPLNLLP